MFTAPLAHGDDNMVVARTKHPSYTLSVPLPAANTPQTTVLSYRSTTAPEPALMLVMLLITPLVTTTRVLDAGTRFLLPKLAVNPPRSSVMSTEIPKSADNVSELSSSFTVSPPVQAATAADSEE